MTLKDVFRIYTEGGADAIDGRVIVEHDGVTEWSDCSVCGARLDPVNDAEVPPHDSPWDGSCYRCGAPAEKVGLARR